jgi:putative glutamine amidotransferase
MLSNRVRSPAVQHPVIALPTGTSGQDFAVRRSYCRALEDAGGVPLVVPLVEREAVLRRLYDLCTGMLLCGGGDVAAEHYGAVNRGKLTFVDLPRDRVELVMTRWALAEGKPLLGICRGAQVLNVAAGGTLVQDIPTEIRGALPHQNQQAQAHDVFVQPGTLLARALGLEEAVDATRLAVNSRHHQTMAQVAPGYRVVASSSDGVIEAIEPLSAAVTSPFVLGVQWHPESLVPADTTMVRLFASFVAACR